MYFLVFVSHDFELGRTWLTGGVDHQSCTGLSFSYTVIIIVTAGYVV